MLAKYIKNNKHLTNILIYLSIEDLELLRSVGVAEREYNFRCEKCGCSCDVISEEKLEKYIADEYPYYSEADIVVETKEEQVDITVSRVIEAINLFLKK